MPLWFTSDINLRYAKTLTMAAALIESHLTQNIQKLIRLRKLHNRIGQVVVCLTVVRHQSSDGFHNVV